MQAAEMSFLQRGAGLSLRDRGRSSTIRREELHHPEGASWSPLFTGFSGTSNWKKAPGQTQNSQEGLYIPSDLGTPQDPPGGAGEGHWGEGCLGFPAGAVGSDPTRPVHDNAAKKMET